MTKAEHDESPWNSPKTSKPNLESSPTTTPTKKKLATKTNQIAMPKGKARKKDQTPLGSDHEEPSTGEGQDIPAVIQPISDDDSPVDDEMGPGGNSEAMFEKIQALTAICERQDVSILRQAKMITNALTFTKDQLNVNNIKTLHANIRAWRESVKKEQQWVINARKTNIEMLNHFPSTRDRIFNHAKHVGELLPDFADWLRLDKPVEDEGDQFGLHLNIPGPASKKCKRSDEEEDADINEDE